MKFISYLSLVGLLVTLLINFLAVQLPINGLTPQEVSNLYPNLFVPSNITFSIWILIYLALLIFVIRFVQQSYLKEYDESLMATHPWFLLGCLLNVGWLFAWHYLWIEVSLFLMIFLLITLAMIYHQAHTQEGPGSWWIRLPFSLYLGWICVALIANTAALLVHYEFSGFGISEPKWTVLMMSTASIIGVGLGLRHRDPIILLPFIWAFLGIYMNRNPYLGPGERNVHAASLVLIVVLCLFEIYLIFKQKPRMMTLSS